MADMDCGHNYTDLVNGPMGKPVCYACTQVQKPFIVQALENARSTGTPVAETDEAARAVFDTAQQSPDYDEAVCCSVSDEYMFLAGVEHGRGEAETNYGAMDVMKQRNDDLRLSLEGQRAKLAKLLAAARQVEGKHTAGCGYNRRYCDDPQCGDSTWDHHCDLPYPCNCDLGALAAAVKLEGKTA